MEQLIFIEINTDNATYTYEKCIVFTGSLITERLKLSKIADYNDLVRDGKTKLFCGVEVMPNNSFRKNIIITLSDWIKNHTYNN